MTEMTTGVSAPAPPGAILSAAQVAAISEQAARIGMPSYPREGGWWAGVQHVATDVPMLVQSHEALRAALARQTAALVALVPYTQHRMMCPMKFNTDMGGCKCGLDEALVAALRGGEAGS